MFRKLCIALIFIQSVSNIRAAVLAGKCIDSYTHKPIPGAVITVEDHKNYFAVTELDGTFRIENLSEGKYRIHAKCLGYDNSYTQDIIIASASQFLKYDLYMKPDNVDVSEVKVSVTTSKESDASARTSEKIASNVINVMSAKTIELLPDLNVANVMQRISGVSMQKNGQGNNERAIIRGMPPRYNGTLVNGTDIPSTSGSSRSVPLNIFPSIFVARIEVTKAPTPDMDGSGLGGLVNIVMKDAPDSAILAVDLATGYNQYLIDHKFSTFDYKAVNIKNPAQLHGADYITSVADFPSSNLVLKHIQAPPDLNGSISYGNRFLNKKLGVLISGTWQTSYQAVVNNYLGTQLNPNLNNLDTNSWNHYELFNQINRKGLIVRLDYRFNDNNQISLYNNYFSMDEIRARYEEDTTSEINKGRLYFGDFTNLDKSSLENLAIHGKHVLSENLDFDWSIIYSYAGSESPDYVSVNYNQVIHPTVQPVYLNYSNAVDRIWQWNTDEEKSAYININYKQLVFDHLFELKVGGMVMDKFRMANENEYDRNFTNTINYPFPDVRNVYSSNVLNTLNDQQLMGDATYNPANFSAFEDIEAGYAMLKTSFGRLKILTGVRVEFTHMFNTHNQLDHGQKVLETGESNYSDVLPSLHLNYVLNQTQNIRASVYTSINRPNINEVIPYTARGANGNSSGNPDLKHAYGTCLDARYEIYPSSEEVFTAGLFYKYLKNPIEDYVNANGDGSFGNAAKCTNYGFEFVGIKYFGNFGLNVNYTYTKSSILDNKNWNDPTANNGLGKTITRVETRPLAGQSPNLINAALIYRSIPLGFKCQLTYTMQGKNLVNRSPNYGLDSYQLAYNDLGFSLDQRLYKSLVMYFKANNLINESVRFQTKNGINTRTESSERSFLLGIKFNL